jgi:hypothetical protein
MKDAERAAIIGDLQRLWRGWSDLRFGQLLRLAVGDTPVRHPGRLTDDLLAAGAAAALRDRPGSPAPPGPYWDTERRTGRTFLNGVPRDPARIPRVLAALARAWDTEPTKSLGQTIERALDSSGIPDDEFNSRLLLIEDGSLRRVLESVVADDSQ